MFVQAECMEKETEVTADDHLTSKKDISERLKAITTELTSVNPYQTPGSERSEPPIRRHRVPPVNNGSLSQRTRSVIHALTRADIRGTHPEVEQQQVSAYSGLQACVNPPVERRKAYNHATYPEPPS